MTLNGFCWIHVNRLHEPSRLVGPDRKKSDIDGSEAIPNFPEVSGISGVSAEVDQAPARPDQITPPERRVAIEGPARGKMLRRGERDGRSRARRGRIPPVHFLDFLDALRTQKHLVAEGDKHPRRKPLIQPSQNRQIQVIVVIVTDDHQIDPRQGFEIDPGLAHSFGTDPAEWTGALRPYGIGENVQSRQLNENRRVVDERYGDLIGAQGGLEIEGRLVSDGIRPFLIAQTSEQFDGFPKTRLFISSGIEKFSAVIVVRERVLRSSASA